MSITVSIGVWSVIVFGARSTSLRRRIGGGSRGSEDMNLESDEDTNSTFDRPQTPSIVLFAFARKERKCKKQTD
jgi:hypothetical protein